MKQQIYDTYQYKGEFFTVLETTEKSQLACMTIGAGKDSGTHGLHNGDQLIYVIEGAGEIEIAGKCQQVKAGGAFIIPAGTKHKAYAAPDQELFFIIIYAPPVY